MQTLTYKDDSKYEGECNSSGQKHGKGSLQFPDRSKYRGQFQNGLPWGDGVMELEDGGRYEGQFSGGKFHGYGVFTNKDGMKYEGQFENGDIRGNGLVTFADGTHGLCRNEGYFEQGELKKPAKCPQAREKAVHAAVQSRSLGQKR